MRIPSAARRTLGVLAALALVPALAAGGIGGATAAAPVAARTGGHAGDVRVGSLVLHPCRVVTGALCGSIRRDRDPADPSAGSIRIGFAFVPARKGRAIGTLVPHEGGPGYATTASGPSYVRMYGDLLRRRNLLLMDQRGTGRSEPVDCPVLQDLRAPFFVAAGRCGMRLGDRSDDYGTVRAADDLAAVAGALELDDLDVYGDSYGTFFTQVFVGRHPDLVRSVVLDASYPTYGESGWYPTSPPAAVRSFRLVCSRSPTCAGHGRGFLHALEAVLGRVRHHPWRGWSHDADGRRMRVAVDPASLVSVVFVATYAPAFYRELTAALRSGLRGDRPPLLRLVAEATGGGTDSGPVRDYSAGLEAATSCHDYAYVYDLTSPPGRPREREYRAALERRSRTHPRTFHPFMVAEYARSDWQGLDWCLRWPVAAESDPAGPVHPPSGAYPDLPVLVLTGELDTVTTPAEGAMVRDQFPGARLVLVRNSFHVTAVDDTDDCAVRLVRAFVRSPADAPTATQRRCAEEVEPIRAPGSFDRVLADDRPGRGTGTARARRVVAVAAGTAADLMDRWWNNYSGHGVGLRGGTWSYRGDRVVRFRLRGVRLVADLAASGRLVWDRYAETARVDLRVDGAAVGHLEGAWNTRRTGAVAVLHGRLDGARVRVSVPAP